MEGNLIIVLDIVWDAKGKSEDILLANKMIHNTDKSCMTLLFSCINMTHLFWKYSDAVFLSWARQHISAAGPNSNLRFCHNLNATRGMFSASGYSYCPIFGYQLHPKLCHCCSCKNLKVLGCIAGSVLVRKAASLAFLNKKRSTVTDDIIEC